MATWVCALVAAGSLVAGVVLVQQSHSLLRVIGSGDYETLRGWSAPPHVPAAYHVALKGDLVTANRRIADAVILQSGRALLSWGFAALAAALATGAYFWRRHLIKGAEPPPYIQALARALLAASNAHEDVEHLVVHARAAHDYAAAAEASDARRALRQMKRAWDKVSIDELEDSLVTLRTALEEIAKERP